jgi:hypothetical protein
MKIHESAKYYTLDTVAECFDGVSAELGQRLWSFIVDEEQPEDGPLYETPGDALGQGPNIVADHWRKFSEAEQQELTAAFDRN